MSEVRGRFSVGELAQRGEDAGLAAGRREVQAVVADRLRQGLVEQFVERVDAERGEHVAQLVGVRTDVAADEVVGRCRGSAGQSVGHLGLSGARGYPLTPHAVVGT